MQPSVLENIKAKILSGDDLVHQLNRWKFFGKKIVFTNGCFDLLHLGHIDYLSKASEQGDVLIVGLNSDASTCGLKGPGRPINSQEQRALILASLQFIDAVVLFDESTPYELIKIVQPDVLVKGSDYNVDDIVGSDIVRAKNGVVKTIDFIPGYSTSLIEEKIRAAKK
jgi:rfaE bifunctional protein nucleotidyltransferase chain/domain